jgi:hypothetical protein
LPAGVHRDVTADARGVGRRRVDCEDVARTVRRFLDASRDGARLGEQRRDRRDHAGQRGQLERRDALELLGVDDRGKRRERHAAAGVACAAAARDDREAGLDAGADQPRDFVLGVRRQHHERVLDAPVGGVRGVGDARESVEADVVGPGMRFERGARPASQFLDSAERLLEVPDRATGELEQAADLCVADRVSRIAALLDVAEPVMQGLDEQAAPVRIVEQVLLEVGVAAHDPDVAEHLVQHPGRAARAPFRAQVVEQRPALRAEQADHDLAIRERGVVVRDLAQPRRWVERCFDFLGGRCVFARRRVRSLSGVELGGGGERTAIVTRAPVLRAPWVFPDP